ncbi:MAG: chorismate dehydratase [Phycisphaerae bacterium]|nr:MAG: chorismate dehydratase [Phycisphaerae bacterium]
MTPGTQAKYSDPVSTEGSRDHSKPTATLGVVSYLNALPLYSTLIGRERVVIRAAVPAKLAALLAAGECDCAMLPVVDYFRRKNALEPVSDGCIASDGETLTVRVFSRVPPDKVTRLCVDGESHTSVILAQVIWRELYGRSLELVPLPSDGTSPDEPIRPVAASGSADDAPDSILLIGDKVIRQAPRGYGFEVDLGAAWKHLTGLPFVFAAWFGPRGRDDAALVRLLGEARDAGVASAAQIAEAAASEHGWPKAIAVEYLCRTLKYTLTPAMREAMERFETLARREGLL